MHQLVYFVKLAQLGNFTRAAEACHVSQPTLSHQIAKLEHELGRPLFERLGRGARLTDAGRVFKDRADQILTLVDDARDSVVEDAEAGRLVVAAIPTVAPYFLPKILVRFAAENPKARVDVREYPTHEILDRIAASEIDLAVLALPIPDEALHVETLRTEQLLLALPTGHPLADKPRLRFKDLAREPFVLLHDTHCLAGETKQLCARHSLAPVTTAQLHQLATVVELVRLGHGVSFVPEMAAANASGLVFRSLGGDAPTRTLAAVWSKLRYRTPLFNRFVQALESKLIDHSHRRGRGERRAVELDLQTKCDRLSHAFHEFVERSRLGVTTGQRGHGCDKDPSSSRSITTLNSRLPAISSRYAGEFHACRGGIR